MADTVINTPVAREDSSAAIAGWVAVLIILAVLVVGAIYILPRLAAPAQAPQGGIDLNVRLPEGVIPGTQGGNQQGGNTEQAPAQ